MKCILLIFIFLFLLSSTWAEETESGFEVSELREGEFGEVTKDGFIILDSNVVRTDPKIAGILNVGVQEATSQAIANGSLYNSPYELADVYSIQQNIANPDEYRSDVTVRNDRQHTVRMEFDLVYNESSNSVEILSWGYPNPFLPVDGEEISSEGISASYQEINFDEDDSEAFVYQIGVAALQVVVATGVLEGKIPNAYYVATNVYKVSEKFEGGKLYYQYDLDAADNKGDSARFIYVVSYDMETKSPNLEEMEIFEVVRVSDEEREG